MSNTPLHCPMDSATTLVVGASLAHVEPSHIHIPRPSRLNQARGQTPAEPVIPTELDLGLDSAA